MGHCDKCMHLDMDRQIGGFFTDTKYYCTCRLEYVHSYDSCIEFDPFPKLEGGYGDQNCLKCLHCLEEDDFNNYTVHKCSVRHEKVGRYDCCALFEKVDDSDGCFLTSACVTYYGKPDDCVELQTLRCFRDSYLRQTEQGQKLVNEYYEIAPRIVEKIEALTEKDIYYQYIYGVVLECVDLITQNDYETAQEKYVEMTRKLKKDLLDD